MNPELRPAERDQFQRLQGHADALLGRVIGLHLQIGLVDPLLGDEEALLPPPDYRRFSGGLTALRESIVRGCVLDFVGSVTDNDNRTPSPDRARHTPTGAGEIGSTGIRPETGIPVHGSCTARTLTLRKPSGASRDRTGDLLLAKQALSQLSYGP